MAKVRQRIVTTEQQDFDSDSLSYLAGQSGMFSLLPLTGPQETALTRDHGIHVVKGGRINVARLRVNDIPDLIRALHSVKRV